MRGKCAIYIIGKPHLCLSKRLKSKEFFGKLYLPYCTIFQNFLPTVLQLILPKYFESNHLYDMCIIVLVTTKHPRVYGKI